MKLIDLWNAETVDNLEQRTVDGWIGNPNVTYQGKPIEGVAPGVGDNAGPRGCFEGKNGRISRCCGGYGNLHAWLGVLRRRIAAGDHDRAQRLAQWIIYSCEHYIAGHDAIMAIEGQPPGEYVDIPHLKDDETDDLRHVNGSGHFRACCEQWFLQYELTAEGKTVGQVLQDRGVLEQMERVARATMQWLFAQNWHRQRNWHIRHHYPIQMAVWASILCREPLYTSAANALLDLYWKNPRIVNGRGRAFNIYDIGRPSDTPAPRLGHGSSQLTFFPWYNTLMPQSLAELYLSPYATEPMRDNCRRIVRDLAGPYVHRFDCWLGDRAGVGAQDFISAPVQGGIDASPEPPWLDDDADASVMDEAAIDARGDSDVWWRRLFFKAVESDGAYHDATIDGMTRFHHSRRFAGAPGTLGQLGPQIEPTTPAKGIVDLFAILAAMEADPGERQALVSRARVYACEQILCMQLSDDTLSKDDMRKLERNPRGFFGTAFGNNRMPYWTMNGYRFFADLWLGPVAQADRSMPEPVLEVGELAIG